MKTSIPLRLVSSCQIPTFSRKVRNYLDPSTYEYTLPTYEDYDKHDINRMKTN